MNIESVLSKIDLFNELVIDSGFKRDIQDYIQSVQQPQNRNLIFLKDISLRVRDFIIRIEDNSIDTELEIVLKNNKPFTKINIVERIQKLLDDNQVNADQYFEKFYTLLNEIANSIEQNEQELDSVHSVFLRYSSNNIPSLLNANDAIISLIFKDLKTISTIKEFTKVLSRWNRTLHTYYTILKSESPEEIKLVEIQNGSIDVLFNIEFDIAIDLTELMKTGLKVYGAYLLYKSSVSKITEFYLGNKKLMKLEQDREKLMLDNIKDSLVQKILEQHQHRLLNDADIDKKADKKIDEVANVIADHIIKGNELRLIASPVEEDKDGNIARELREETTVVRERYKSLKQSEKQLLIDKYSLKEED